MQQNRLEEILIFLILFLSGVYFYHPVEYDNTLSRYFLLSAVIDKGELNIDENNKFTIDDSFYKGHYYSNKAIGASLISLPLYWFSKKISLFSSSTYWVSNIKIFDMYFVRIVSTTLLFAITGILIFRLLNKWKIGDRNSLWVVLGISLGTVSFLHATMFSGHQIAASLSFFSFYIAVKISEPGVNTIRRKSYLLAFISGLSAGLGALSDYTAIYLAFIITAYLCLSHISWKEIFSFLSGGILCMILLGVYNNHCFGSPFSLSYEHLVNEGFKKGSEVGLWGISIPRLIPLASILFSSSKGLFFISPLLFFSLLGLPNMWKEKKRETITVIIMVVGYFLINAGFYGWHGGWIYGPRYLVPILPFLALPMAYYQIECSHWYKLFFMLSIFQVTFAVMGVPHVPGIFENPIKEFIIPMMRYGYYAKNGGELLGIPGPWSAIPIVLLITGLSFYLFRKSKYGNCIEKTTRLTNIFFCVLFLYIVATLSLSSSSVAQITSHSYKRRILMDAAAATNLEYLYIAGLQEELMEKSLLQENRDN